MSSNGTSIVKSDVTVEMTVPANLKTLIRMIMKAFYGFELYLCMEMLMVYPCIKEEDLAELLRLDLKHVHQHLVNLKKEKFINEISLMVTSTDGRQAKHSFFYINYKMMVNVIKYKLDKIRVQIESEEKQCTSRANFKCTNCHKTYSDLDTKDIFLTMTCLYCNAEVEEDMSCLPNRSNRNLLAKFNTQMEIVFELLSRVEHIQLADDILRPEPVDITHVLEKMVNTSSNNLLGQNGANKNGPNGKPALVKYDAMGNVKWSGDKTRNTDNRQPNILINFDLADSTTTNTRQQKQLPSILLLNQTNEDDLSSRDSQLLNSIKQAADATQNNNDYSTLQSATSSLGSPALTTLPTTIPSVQNNNNTKPNLNSTNLESIIMQKLLIHEKKINLVNDSVKELNLNGDGGLLNGKKRDFDSLIKTDARKQSDFYSKNGYDQIDDRLKKRKLNNGDIVSFNSKNGKTTNGYTNLHHQKSYSDGSDRELDEQDDESSSYYNETESSSDLNQDEDQTIPRVQIQNKFYRLDKLNPNLINLMNEAEKEFYINICRQLYTEIYEI